MTKHRQSILDLLEALSATHGEPRVSDPVKLAAAWHLALEPLTDEQVKAATPAALRRKAYGWPQPADVIECALGRTVKVPEYATDLHGCRFREKPEGPLVVERWHEVRVPHEWDGDPGELDYTNLPPEIRAHHRALEEAQAKQLTAGGRE